MSYHPTTVKSCCSVAKSGLTLIPRAAALQASLAFTVSQSFLTFMSIESVMPSNHLTLCCPLLLLPPIFPIIRVVSNDLALRIRWSKYWSFSFSISPSSEYSGLISFRIDLSKYIKIIANSSNLTKFNIDDDQGNIKGTEIKCVYLFIKTSIFLGTSLVVQWL